ncbi:MAG: TIM barrel protein [Yoonia sp.]
MLTIATTNVSGTLPEKLRAIASVGFQGIELSTVDLINADISAREVRTEAEALGLKVAAFGPIETASVAHLKAAIVQAHDLGAPILLVPAQASPSDLSQVVTQAQAARVRIALCPSGGESGESRALDVITAVDQDYVGLCLNSLDVLRDGSRPARLRDLPVDRLFHVQLSDGPLSNVGDRHLPGQGDLNLTEFVRLLASKGYAQAWSVSCAMQPDNAARDGWRALVSLLDDVSRTEPSLHFGTPDLPARVPAVGIEFIEFTVDGASAFALEAILIAMRFRLERQHRTKNVSLWRQGAINIVVNQEQSGHARNAFVNHGPSICDMGLRVADAAATSNRAMLLGATNFNQPVGLGELDIPAIRSVGGSVIHFIDEHSNLHRVWDIEFAPVDRISNAQPAGLRRIDHIAQTMQFDEMQSWLLYYVSTFEMQKTPIVNVTDPLGVVLSQSVASPEGEVRLNLNGAQGQRTFAGHFVADNFGAGVQHLAFRTDDVFETSAVLAVSDFPRLPVPTNYYVDTQAKFGLSDAFTKQIQDAQIMYDEDEAGAYFQLYSTPIFGGFFFELVQRTGGYAGYGARNASVRLAAQAKYKPVAGMPKR